MIILLIFNTEQNRITLGCRPCLMIVCRAANCDKGKNALSRIKKCFLGVKNAFQGRGRGRKGGGEEKKGRGRAAGGGSGGEGSSPHPEVKCQ